MKIFVLTMLIISSSVYSNSCGDKVFGFLNKFNYTKNMMAKSASQISCVLSKVEDYKQNSKLAFAGVKKISHKINYYAPLLPCLYEHYKEDMKVLHRNIKNGTSNTQTDQILKKLRNDFNLRIQELEISINEDEKCTK